MKNRNFWLLLGANLLSIILVVCGVIMGFNHIKGWGWLIMAALMIYGSPKSIITIKGEGKKKKDKKTKTEDSKTE